MKIKRVFILFLMAGLLSCNSNDDKHIQLIDITGINKNIILDIKYATKDNFLKEAVYSQARCYLVEEAALKIDSIQSELGCQELGLKIFDGYRPFSVTKKMWEILPDDRYVANPKNGSRHNRGAAVDLTLVDSTGTELEMPTKFDDFTEKAAHAYEDLPEQLIKNRRRLKDIMEEYGFSAIKSEWWHYDLKNYQK